MFDVIMGKPVGSFIVSFDRVICWGCPNSSNVALDGIAVFMLWKRPPISASVELDWTNLNNLHSTNTGALNDGCAWMG